MVLGLGLKTKGATVKVEFQIQVQEIKPWNLVDTGESVPLLVKWQRGDNRSGRTKGVLPTQEDGGKLAFNDTFRLPAKLVREPTGNSRGGRTTVLPKFQKKTIVFILQEEITNLQLARCVMDLAEYGDHHSRVLVSVPLAVGKKVDSGGSRPSLYLTIGPVEKEERSFASRVSFGSSTPRSSVSSKELKAPVKAGMVSGKSRIEPDLDEDQRRSIVAALMSDDDDNVSIESFTDDDNTPEDSTPKSDTCLESLTIGSEVSKDSTTSTMSETSKLPTNIPVASKWAKKSNSSSSSSSSTSQPAVQTHTKSPWNSPLHLSPRTTKHSPGSPTSSAAEEAQQRSRHVPAGQAFGTATEVLTMSAKEVFTSSNPTVAPTASITQLFSSNPVYKSTMIAENSESAHLPTKSMSMKSGFSPESESQSSHVVNRPPYLEQGDEDAPATLSSVASPSNEGSGSSTGSRGPVPSSELPQNLDSKLTGKSATSRVTAVCKKGSQLSGTERRNSPRAPANVEEELSQETAAPVLPAPIRVAAAAAAAASAYMASRTFKSFEGAAFDNMSEISEDSLSESSVGGRSSARHPLPEEPHTPGRPTSSSVTSVDAKGGENKEASDISVSAEKQLNGSKTSIRKRLDVKKDPRCEVETMQEVAYKQEESTAHGGCVLLSARANLAKMEKRAIEELRKEIGNVEAKLSAELDKVERLQGELRDVGAMEVSVYCVVAEHGNSSHKLHTPARRLARLYMHAHEHWSPERRAGTVKNCVSGLVTVAKSCGSDVSRWSFWWSNVVTLRAVITQAFAKGLSSAEGGQKAEDNLLSRANGIGFTGCARPRSSVGQSSSTLSLRKPASADWQEASSYIAALEKIEEWIYAKIIESLWWQAMMPRMQKDVDASTPTSPKGMALLSPSAFGSANEDFSKLAGNITGILVKKPRRRPSFLPELGDTRQGNVSVEVWKKAIMEALRRLCPVRGAGHECGCLPMLIKMAIEGCVARLDVALFNAILREPDDDVPTDPFSDPVSDLSVLPISPGGLSFGGGSQLKNVVVTWSTFIAGLVTVKEPACGLDVEDGGNTETFEDTEKSPRFFNLIKATGDLLMLPKDILMDRGIRKEICPMLSLQLIRRILVNFVPDEFAPDPISPSLLAALNAEASLEKQRQGEADSISTSTAMAVAPPVVYLAPSADQLWSWIGETSVDLSSWGRNNNSLLRRGYTSDEDLTILEQLQKSSATNKLDVLLGNAIGKQLQSSTAETKPYEGATSGGSRFELLKELWGSV